MVRTFSFIRKIFLDKRLDVCVDYEHVTGMLQSVQKTPRKRVVVGFLEKNGVKGRGYAVYGL